MNSLEEGSVRIYANDSNSKSLFHKSCPGFNPNELDTGLREAIVRQYNLNDQYNLSIKGDVPGITTSFVYGGTHSSLFALHWEDWCLHSISFLHFGDVRYSNMLNMIQQNYVQIKWWLAIPESEAKKLHKLLAKLLPEEFAKCAGHIQHKELFIHPQFLIDNDISFYVAFQQPGEFIISELGTDFLGSDVNF